MAFQPSEFRDFDPVERPLVDEWVKVRNVRRRGVKPAGLRGAMIGVGALGLVLVSFAVVRMASSSKPREKPPVTHPAPVKTGVVLSLVLEHDTKGPRHPGDLVKGTLTLVGDDESLHHANLKAALLPVADSDVRIVKSMGPFKADPGYQHQYVREIQVRMPMVKEAAPLNVHVEASGLVAGTRTTRAEPVEILVAPKPPPAPPKSPDRPESRRGSHEEREHEPERPKPTAPPPIDKPRVEVDPVDKDH